MAFAASDSTIQQWTMPVNLYVEALLADEAMADQVWELWNAGLIPDELATMCWLVSAFSESGHSGDLKLIFNGHLRPEADSPHSSKYS